MDKEHWGKIKGLLDDSLKLAASERAAFLKKNCADEEMRREVESLLSSFDNPDSFLEKPGTELFSVIAENEQLKAGQVITHYKLIRPLGAGGMGEVYLAHDTKLNRKVALKVLPADLISNRERLHRFEQEAQAASALNHPNIITIHEIGMEGDTHFIATEFIEGETLRQKLHAADLKIEETLNIATQIAAALDAAHGNGIIHRDIKPENIMVRADGLLKVLDFGLAKLTERKDSLPADGEDSTRIQVQTVEGAVMGTVSYMSPEQARGLSVD